MESKIEKSVSSNYILNILCGGKGERIGGNKAFYQFNGVPLIEHCINRLSPQGEIILSLDSAQNPMLAEYQKYGFPIVFDDDAFTGFGPMAGVLSGLEYCAQKFEAFKYIIAPCDMPHLPDDYAERLLSENNSCYYKGERDYPLCAQLDKNAIAPLRSALENCQNGLGAFRFLQSIGASPIRIANEANFLNINCPI